MKKSIATIKQNPELVLFVGATALLIVAVTYNILVNGITSSSSFEF